MKIDYFTIKVWTKDGQVHETRRHTQEGMTTCVNQYENARGVAKIRVYEHVSLDA